MSPQEKSSITQLPWYDSLREYLEPYLPASNLMDADKELSSAEIIAAIEQHHGTPQGVVGNEIHSFVGSDDFVAAMKRLGYRSANTGTGLHWLLKRKS